VSLVVDLLTVQLTRGEQITLNQPRSDSANLTIEFVIATGLISVSTASTGKHLCVILILSTDLG